MKKKIIAILTSAMMGTSLLAVGLLSKNLSVSAEAALQDEYLGLTNVSLTDAPANLTVIKGTSTIESGTGDGSRRAMGKGDSFEISATFGANEENKNAFLRAEAEGDRKIEITNDGGTTWHTIGEKDTENTSSASADPGLKTIYKADIRAERHRNEKESQVTFYDISEYVPAEGANIKVRFSTPDDAEQDGVIFWNCKLFRAHTFDFGDDNMTEVVNVKDESVYFDRHRAATNGEGFTYVDGWGFYAFRVTFPAGAEDAHLLTELGGGNFGMSVIREDGSREDEISWKDKDDKHGALLNVGPNEWNEGLLHFSLKDYLNSDESATSLIIKMTPHNLGQGSGPQVKRLQFSYTTQAVTSSPMPGAGIEDIVNVYEIKKDATENEGVWTSDSPYFVFDNGATNQPENNTYYDADKYAIYKLPYKAGIERAVLRAKVRGYYLLSVSADGTAWKDVAVGDIMTGDGNGPAQSDIFIDVTDFTDNSQAGFVFVKFADNSASNGWGPKWEKLGLDCNYGDKTLSFTGDTIEVDVSDDGMIQDRWGAPYTANGNHRFADGDQYFTYKIDVSSNVTALYMRAKVGGGNRKIEVSKDNGTTWTAIDDAKQENAAADVVKADGLYYNLGGYLEDAVALLVRFGCNDAGSGSDLNNLTFVRNADFDEIANSGATLTIGQNEKEFAVHVKDESKMWQLNGTASEATSYGGGWHRFADTSSFFTYKLEFPATAKENVWMRVDIQGSNKHIEVSNDGKSWTSICFNGINDGDPLQGAALLDGRFSYFALDDYLASSSTLFVRFGAKNTSQGNGSDVYSNIYFLIGQEVSNGKGVLELGDNMIQNVNLSDASLLAQNNGSEFGRTDDQIFRRANGANSFTYKLQFPSDTEFAYFMARMKNTDGMYIQVSVDGEKFTDLGYRGMDDLNGASYIDGDRCFYSLDRYLNNLTDKTLWLKFASYEENANGTELYELLMFYNRPFNSEVTYPANPSVEEITMIAGPDEENYKDTALSVGSGGFDGDGFRFYDAGNYGVYKFEYHGDPSVLKLVTEVRGGYRVSVSKDGVTWVDVLISDIHYAPAGAPLQNRSYFDFNITEFLNENKTVYVKVADSTDWHGWGGALSRITLLAVSEGETVAKEPVFGEDCLITKVPLQNAAYIEAENGSTFEFTGRGVEGSDAYFTYKFALAEDATTFFIAFNYRGQIRVDVSTDGTTFYSVPDAHIISGEYGKGSAVTYDLGYLLSTSKTIYVRFTDGNVNDGEAAVLLSLYAGYNSAAVSDPGKLYETQTHDTFIAGTEEEKEHTHVMDKENVENRWEFRNINKNANVIYKFTYSETAEHLRLLVSVGGTFLVSVSTDGVHFKDVLVSASQYYAASGVIEDTFYATVKEYAIDLTSFMQGNTDRILYVKISDPIDDNDFGAQLVGLGLTSMSGAEIEAPVYGQPQRNNTGLIVGLCCGIGGAVIVAAVVTAVLLKKRAAKTANGGQKDQENK